MIAQQGSASHGLGRKRGFFERSLITVQVVSFRLLYIGARNCVHCGTVHFRNGGGSR